jgi:hypothetical protein
MFQKIILFVVADVRASNPLTSFLSAGYKKYWLEVTFWHLLTIGFCLVSTAAELLGWKCLAGDKWVKLNEN